MYHEVLVGRVLSDDDLDLEIVDKDLERRNLFNIPPGFKDKSKEENQAGDLLIWHEILKLAGDRQQHLVFISGDEKPDWWHKSGKKPLYPRFELVDEYREKSGGKSFHMMSLSGLLKLFGAEDDVVEAIKSSEKSLKLKTRQSQLSNDELYEKSMDIVKEVRTVLAEKRIESDQMVAGDFGW